MKKTGEMLKKVREEKKLSLHEIGLSLKISSKILQAIEAGDETQLPAKTFLRGFVKSYAAYLRMDVDAVMKSFQEEMGTTSPQPLIRPTKLDLPPAEETTLDEEGNMVPVNKPTPVPDAPKASTYDVLHRPRNAKSIFFLILAVILVVLILGVKRMINKYTKEAELPKTEVTEPLAVPSPTASLSPTPAASTSENPEGPIDTTPPDDQTTPAPKPGAATLIPATKTVVNSSTPATTPAAKPMSSPASTATPAPSAAVGAAAKSEAPKATPTPVVVKATPAPSASPAASPSPSASPKADAEVAASPTPSPTVAKAEAVELIVEALDNVEIEYSAPKGKPQKIKLSAEQIHTFKSRSGLKINFSNGGAVNLILNGREIGIPGDLGQPIKLSY